MLGARMSCSWTTKLTMTSTLDTTYLDLAQIDVSLQEVHSGAQTCTDTRRKRVGLIEDNSLDVAIIIEMDETIQMEEITYHAQDTQSRSANR